jgi:hypothetical protein
VTELLSAGRKKATDTDVGKPVVTCSGDHVGELRTVDQSGEFTVAIDAEGVRSGRLPDDASAGEDVCLPPEALGLVTPDRVWLRE